MSFSIDLDAPVSQLQEMVTDEEGIPVRKKSPLANSIIVNYILL
jgi:hypothetical protein